jgi:hypothetical protein
MADNEPLRKLQAEYLELDDKYERLLKATRALLDKIKGSAWEVLDESKRLQDIIANETT